MAKKRIDFGGQSHYLFTQVENLGNNTTIHISGSFRQSFPKKSPGNSTLWRPFSLSKGDPSSINFVAFDRDERRIRTNRMLKGVVDQDRRVEDNRRRGGKLKGAGQGNMSISGYDLDIPVSRESGDATPRHTKETTFHGDFESWRIQEFKNFLEIPRYLARLLPEFTRNP
ncbi:hypothetical protein K0M31_008335 [Melipona bicolor]|uniref:Uncharacterized protein n=1 Tax=Melipona bicolor TaxID=60889 RepID=A0AA40FQS6_9HYME|nr:hypothetical protein K0M31_008335 [Melipona bicolor]